MTPAVIMDIDGTLANAEHRLHLLPSNVKEIGYPNIPPDEAWKRFYDACVHDAPNTEIVTLNNAMAAVARIIMVTGRSEYSRVETETWLRNHNIQFDELLMREQGDHRPDTAVKVEILAKIREEHEVLFAVEDRASVTKMWRENGVRCLQVCEGAY